MKVLKQPQTFSKFISQKQSESDSKRTYEILAIGDIVYSTTSFAHNHPNFEVYLLSYIKKGAKNLDYQIEITTLSWQYYPHVTIGSTITPKGQLSNKASLDINREFIISSPIDFERKICQIDVFYCFQSNRL